MAYQPFTESDKTAFGELSVAELTPVVQLHFPYNVNDFLVDARLNNGAATVDSNRLKLSTGAAANQSAQLLSKRAVTYQPGQGGLWRGTAVFTAGAANSTQYIGIGSSSDGYFFGFNGTAFGIMRRQGGSPEVRLLTVTTGSSTAEDITITLDGDAVATVTVTNTADTTLTANEIAAHDYSNLGQGWAAHSMGATVRFESYNAASQTGTYSLSSATTAVGTFGQDVAGAAPTETVVAQTSWNVDKAAGAEDLPSLTFTNGNVFQIQYQWLGYGAINFYIEHPGDGGFHLVHRIQYANSATVPSVDNPTLPLCAAVKNTSNTTDIVMFVGSMGGFIEGKESELGIRRGASSGEVTVGTTELPLLTIHNRIIHNSVVNRKRIRLAFAVLSNDGTKSGTIKFKTNATLTGAVFSDIDASNSVVRTDTTATAITASTGVEQFDVALPKSGQVVIDLHDLKIELEPEDFLTISGLGSAASAAFTVSVNWVEI
jgi:hypothetical protein